MNFQGKKKDNKGIKLIKTFIKNRYYLYGKINGEKKMSINNKNNTKKNTESADNTNKGSPSFK